MSVVPVICENEQCQNVQGNSWPPECERNFVEIIAFCSDRRVEGD